MAGRTAKKQIEKLGKGYSSGSYTTARPLDQAESSHSEEDITPDVLNFFKRKC